MKYTKDHIIHIRVYEIFVIECYQKFIKQGIFKFYF